MRILCVDALGSGFCNLDFKNPNDDVFSLARVLDSYFDDVRYYPCDVDGNLYFNF